MKKCRNLLKHLSKQRVKNLRYRFFTRINLPVTHTLVVIDLFKYDVPYQAVAKRYGLPNHRVSSIPLEISRRIRSFAKTDSAIKKNISNMEAIRLMLGLIK